MSTALLHSPEFYMHRCLQLARLGQAYVSPNPMVGAVLVHGQQIIGEGYHQQYGGPHAEVHCIEAAIANGHEELLQESELFVSLEPCAHTGKTPPCADLIIKHKIPSVWIGCRDPFHQVDGKGIEKLQAAGIKVVSGVMEKECRELNKHFFYFHNHHQPYVLLKWAQTVDGYAGKSGSRLMISHEITQRYVHEWRSHHTAILVGSKTALADDPALTNRLAPGKHPVRLVIDRQNVLPESLKIFCPNAPVFIFNHSRHHMPEGIIYPELAHEVYHYKIAKNENVLTSILQALTSLQIQSVLVEGGPQLQQLFIDQQSWNEAVVITNETMMAHNGVKAPHLHHANFEKGLAVESDYIRWYSPHQNMYTR